MNEETPNPDFKKLAKDLAKNAQIVIVPRFAATLYQDDLLLSTGQAGVSGNDVSFFPESPKLLDAVLRDPITLTETETQVSRILTHSRELLSASGSQIWFFQIKNEEEKNLH